MTAKLTTENNINKYSLLRVVEYKQISVTFALLDAPQPIIGRNAIMKINSQDRVITEATLRGAVRVGYRNGRLSAKYRSRLIRVKFKLEAPKRKTVRGMTTRHGIRGLFRPV